MRRSSHQSVFLAKHSHDGRILVAKCYLQGLRGGRDGLAIRRVPAGDEDEEGGLKEVRENGPETLH